MRIALERAVGAVGRARYGGSRSMRALLLTLPKYVDADVARAAADLWYSLCRVAHHQDYELVPTLGELRAWQARTVRVTDALLRSAASAGTPADRLPGRPVE
ncbi:hypothetical protein [Umezawaea beigongshangensis]|uniref:hypothetical protein n=1 Tax=Umezawaea beigongshangensis TaxID=2780383 RepID=UPI0018F13DDE|nr:hypothetical protein [Umezawaea beigongshangensis]